MPPLIPVQEFESRGLIGTLSKLDQITAVSSSVSTILGVKAFLLAGLVVVISCAGLPGNAEAQDVAHDALIASLPDAPGLASPQAPPAAAEGNTGNVFGTVQDSDGAVVPGARVVLTAKSGVERILSSDSGGDFNFTALPPGAYRVTVTSAGMGSYVSSEIRLLAGGKQEISQVILPIEVAHVDVRVEVTQAEIATEQVSLQEQQRLFGVLPNFYTSYVWNPAPLSPRLKFQLALKSATDPVAFVGAAALAGVQQAGGTLPGYGQESGGYFKRFGAAYADDAIARMIGSAILPTVLRQDPRYFYQGSGSAVSRGLHAVSSAIICRGDNGHNQLNYSRVLGSLAAGGIANLYHSPQDKGVSLVFRNTLIDIAGNAGTNLLREFLFRRLTPKVPDYNNGKP